MFTDCFVDRLLSKLLEQRTSSEERLIPHSQNVVRNVVNY